jgi:hypothetical protein
VEKENNLEQRTWRSRDYVGVLHPARHVCHVVNDIFCKIGENDGFTRHTVDAVQPNCMQTADEQTAILTRPVSS